MLILGFESDNSIDEIGVFFAEISPLRFRISERELGSVRKMETVNAEAKTAVASLLPLASASLQPYVSELLSFTLDRLHKDSELLRVDAEIIQRQIQEVAVANCRAFISAADALLSICKKVSSIDKHLEQLIFEIPKLTSGCTEFVESGEQILEKKKLNQTLLA